MNKKCLILGANSDIGQALAYHFASKGFDLMLAVRTVSDYQIRLKKDIQIKYSVGVNHFCFNGLNYNEHDAFWSSFPILPDVVICVFGYLGDQSIAINDFNEAYAIMGANYIGAVSLLNRFVCLARGKKEATIIGVSSVAGERGRKSNYIYGSSKAAFTNYLSGLRNDLMADNIHVITVLPGFVKTKMIDGMKTSPLLTAMPNEVARAVFDAYQKKKNTLYVYPIWRYIMLVIKLIPEFIFKRLSL